MNRIKIAVCVFGVAALSACGDHQIPEYRKVHRAPTNNSETGVIVSGLSESKVTDLLNQNPSFKVRVVNGNHDLYELFGATEVELKSKINDADVTIEKNKFFELDNLTASTSAAIVADEPEYPFVEAIEKNQGVPLSGEAQAFAADCKLNPNTAPQITIQVNQKNDRNDGGILFELGQSLKIDATKSKPKGTAKTLKYMWVVSSPNDTALHPIVSFEDKIDFQPDTTGTHVYSVIAKDNLGYCQMDMEPFYVTENDPFLPIDPLPDSASEKLNADVFWHVIFVGARDAWQMAVGAGITIGVIDSGVDYNHRALSSNILLNQGEIPGNGKDDDGNGFVDDVVGYDFGLDDPYPFDDFGHGTHVAGIAASNAFGAARKAKILPVKFGGGLGFDIASVTGAIKYSVDRGAKVLNMSFTSKEDFAVVHNAIKYAEDHNVLVVAAAGNETNDNDKSPSYPCNYTNANVLSIAASDENNHLTEYSNFGHSVHIAAPGGTPDKPIFSSYKRNPLKKQYKGMMGTSMAAPLVAGVAAQIWSANPKLTAVQVKGILLETGKPFDALKGQISSGKVIDAKAALQKVTGLESSATSL